MIRHMIDTLLTTEHPLSLVSDPDNILQDEQLLARLTDKGFKIVRERDTVALRAEIQQLRAESGQPVVVITSQALDALPYDLWQQGQHITLALEDMFPNLDYYVIHRLSAVQRTRLATAYQAHPPAQPLSPVETQDYLLRAVFDAAPERLDRPASLLLWLDAHHNQVDGMTLPFIERLLVHLKQNPAFSEWPLWSLLISAENYREFVRDAWQREVGHFLREDRGEYEILPFGEDEALQDALPRLVRTGTVVPIAIDQSIHLPAWASSAVAVDAQAVRRRQLDEAMQAIDEDLRPDELRWEQWEVIARRWAQITVWRYDYDFNLAPSQRETLTALEAALDRRFASWLQGHYALLAGNALPLPHHVFHSLKFIEYLNQRTQRVALLVLDGMSLADWTLIRATWQARHDEWDIYDHLVLAQVPSITAVSRQALISGLRPARFADTLTTTRHEGRRWSEYWQARENVTADRFFYATLSDRPGAAFPSAVGSQRTIASCLVSNVIDNMLHGATQGSADMQASLRLWLTDGSYELEAHIDQLLNDGMMVVLASDHGHVEAIGMGQPQEGVTVETRSKRARLYNNADFARTVHEQFPETILWQDDSLLPPGWLALMPAGRKAFAAKDTRIVSHGGLTIDEMVVPLITIENW